MLLRDRMRALMERRNLTRRELADALGTNHYTCRGWLDLGRTPPAAIAQLLTLIEESSSVRRRLGLSHGKQLPRGRPFPKGHQFRFNDPRRPAALAAARTRREAA